MKFWFFSVLILTLSLQAQAATEDPLSFAGRDSMNGYRLDQFKDFEKNWHFVTVRYRKDTGEMRFTYANETAWKTLQQNSDKKSVEYPEGAVFAKIGMATHEDTAFASSAVPGGVRRYQFMVRNKEKHKDTDGWGYALFDGQGQTFPEDPKATTLACAACHRLVPERGFVFSQNMNAAFSIHLDHQAAAGTVSAKFKSEKVSSLPALVRASLPQGTKTVRLLEGEMRDHLFQGTLDEIRPVLASESAQTKIPALLLSRDQKRFSLVYADPKMTCENKSKGFKGIANISFKSNENFETAFCQPQP